MQHYTYEISDWPHEPDEAATVFWEQRSDDLAAHDQFTTGDVTVREKAAWTRTRKPSLDKTLRRSDVHPPTSHAAKAYTYKEVDNAPTT